jgi:hypothetical protein
MVKYGQIDATHVYKNPMASADAESVTFVIDRHLYVFQMGARELQRLARQIDAALKAKSALARKRKA